MYAFPEMIELTGREFPTPAHKQVAQRIAICNPNVFQADVLAAVVDAINAVPNKRIKGVTYDELVNDFNMPDVGVPTVSSYVWFPSYE